MLLWALQKLRRKGPKAPGPDGKRASDICITEEFSFVREIRECVRAKKYWHGALRKCSIAKSNGKKRIIQIANLADQVISTSLSQVLSAYLDVEFSRNSFGFRPGLGRERALLAAISKAEERGRFVWTVADISKAFDRIPRRDLMQVIAHYFRTCPDLVQLINRHVPSLGRRGIPQGLSISPVLLNLYLHHYLDQHDRYHFHVASVNRYADDFLLLTKTKAQAELSLQTLEMCLGDVGLTTRRAGESEKSSLIVELEKASIGWLGFTIKVLDGEWRFSLTKEKWEIFKGKVAELAKREDAHRHIPRFVEGWLAQNAVVYRPCNAKRQLASIKQILTNHGFAELCDTRRWETIWAEARHRWDKLCALDA